jgi:predicted lipid-binding transport protein (Tim44 family)
VRYAFYGSGSYDEEAIMNTFSRLLPLLFGLLLLGGCQIAGDIFKAGIWVGVLIVIAIIGGVIWLVSRA